MSENPIESLLNKSATSFKGSELFGYASTKKTLAETIQLLKSTIGIDSSSAAAAYGMLLSINTCKEGSYREDALNALDQLSLTKMLLDRAACHLSPVINVTSDILFAAQNFAEEATIPCTEWPSVTEIAEVVLTKCMNYAKVREWKLYMYNETGVVIGTYIAD
jgi:hypothetical protein